MKISIFANLTRRCIMNQLPFLRIEKENFPITVDYGTPLEHMQQEVSAKLAWSGTLNLRKRTFPFDSGIKEFVCYYATLLDESELSEIREYSQNSQIILADMKQLFAFGCAYVRTEVTKKKTAPVVATAEGSTWLCSHECSDELAGFDWEPFYHSPGPRIQTFFGPLEAGTRLLAIR